MDPKHTAFENCLQYVLEGASIEDALKRYPVWADELRPLLETALFARNLGEETQVPRGAQLRSRASFLQAARALERPRQRNFFAAPVRWSFASLVVLLALIFGGFTTVAIAAQALPGEPLYPLKLMTEQTRLQLASDPVEHLNLQQRFDRERLEEVDALIGRGLASHVEFVGGLSGTQGDEWIVNDVRVLVTGATQVEGDIQVGFHVGVEGSLQPDGSVMASRVWDRRFRVSGLAQVIARSYWVVDNVRIAIGQDTYFSGPYGPGSRVEISAGKLLNGQLIARSIEILSVPGVVISNTHTPEATETPLPTATFAPSPQPGETSEADPTSESREIEPTSAEDDQAEVETPEPTEVDEQEETPEPTESPGDGDPGDPGGGDDGGGEEDEPETPEPTEPEDDGEDTPEPTEQEDDGGGDDGEETPEPTEQEGDRQTSRSTFLRMD